MAVTRRAQFSGEVGGQFETQYASAVSVLSTTAQAKTGNRSIIITGGEYGGFDSNYSKFRIGFFMRHRGYPSNMSANTISGILRFEDGAGEFYLIGWRPFEGYLSYYSSFTSAFSHDIPIARWRLQAANRWRHIGAFIENGVSLTLYVDGVETMQVAPFPTVIETYVGGNVGATGITYYMDDFYLDELTDEVDHCPPTVRFYLSLPSADGTDVAWTPSAGNRWQAVDEVPSNTTDYIYAEAADLKNTVNTVNISVDEDLYSFTAVLVDIIALTDVGTPDIRTIIRDGVTYLNGLTRALTTSYALYTDRQMVQPDSSAWNVTDFNALEYGVESLGTF